MRPRTIPRRLRLAGDVDYPKGVERVRTRPDCEGGPRPCPFVSCRFHLFLDVNPETGSVKLNFPEIAAEIEAQGNGLPLTKLADTCALDVADRGDATLEDVGLRINVTRERARQIEAKALGKMLDDDVLRELSDDAGGGEALPAVLEAARRERLHRQEGPSGAVVRTVPPSLRGVGVNDARAEDGDPPGGAAPDWDWGPAESEPLEEEREP